MTSTRVVTYSSFLQGWLDSTVVLRSVMETEGRHQGLPTLDLQVEGLEGSVLHDNYTCRVT